MKRTLIFSLILMLALTMHAQTTVTFMGVPVNGEQESFRQKLLKKGCYTDKNSVLKGVVDGTLSTIIINTTDDKVTSITAIEDEAIKDETLAVARYNHLLDHYKAISDYTEFETNPYAQSESKETMRKYINEEWYYAEFFQKAQPQRYTRRMGIKLTDKYGDYRIVRHYDNNYDIDANLPK